MYMIVLLDLFVLGKLPVTSLEFDAGKYVMKIGCGKEHVFWTTQLWTVVRYYGAQLSGLDSMRHPTSDPHHMHACTV